MREKLKDAASWINLVLILGALATGGYYWAQQESKQFDTVEQKARTVIHTEDAEEVIFELKEARRADKMNAQDAIRSRRERDSLLKRAIELAERNAVSSYQNKKATDSIIKLWKNYNDNASN